MYEDALELLNSRDADIQNDKSILQVLSATSLSTPTAWDKIIHIRNGSIRYAACQSFLNETVGKCEVCQSGDIRVIFSLFDTTISLPGKAATDQQITVSFETILRPIESPNAQYKIVSQKEKDAEQYLSLLRHKGAISELVRVRVPEDSKFWSDWICCLYYIFILHPSDLIHSRNGVGYWEALLDEERMKRKRRERKDWEDWNAQRRTVQYFKEKLYPKLYLFELPISIQINQRAYPVDKFFSLYGL